MSLGSGIEWTDATWNPVTGCTKVSPGCVNCYAEAFAERWRGVPGHHFEKGFDVQLRPERLSLPLKWRKSQRIFVNSMSDLFHEAVPDDFIQAVFTTMAQATHHTFQVLTKRAARMNTLLSRWAGEGLTLRSGYGVKLPNVWLGVSVENQVTANERIPLLLNTPAAVRFLSCEPLLGPVDLLQLPELLRPDHGLHWVIVGGESGPKARPMDPDWVRLIRDQVAPAEPKVAFFFKQWGEFVQLGQAPDDTATAIDAGAPGGMTDTDLFRVGKKKAGRLLDGRTWDEFPGGAA
jgi:protein gp37